MLPKEFVARMEGMLGEGAEAFLAEYGKEPWQALRFNPGKGSLEEFLGKHPFHLEPVPWEKNGFYYKKEDQPGKHPFHDAGVYYIQEPSAMAPAGLLEAEPGEKILDLCAAPGGKSTQLAAALKGRGLLVSNEIHPARAKILSENIERMGIGNCLVLNEPPERLLLEFPEYFDRILVDAPCSGEGMFRKNPEAVQEWSLENVELCAGRQDGILDCAAGMLRPGGRLVYSTCTFAPEEDEGSAERFLQRNSDFQLQDMHRLWPHKIRGEGHFAAVFTKAGEASGYETYSRGGLQKGISRKDCGDYFAFEEETLKRPAEELVRNTLYLKFGDQLYLCPACLPSLKGLKVLRPGLHLGTFKKNRFEPSHALALALRPEMVKRSLDLDSEGQRVREYLNGSTFPAEGDKGWYLITVDGYSLGWGKLAGGIMKNHYPRGLRSL